MATFSERCAARKLVKSSCRYFIYRGNEHDLFISLPDYEQLQSHFEIVFDKFGIEPPAIYFKKKKYLLTGFPLLTEDFGYFCIFGKFKGSKGLHKIPLHRLAYVAFYGSVPVGFHIHHIDRNKHNNAAANLVALTEEEHCQVHGRDVKIPKNLFTKSQRGLLSGYKKEETLDVYELLKQPYSKENLDLLLSVVLTTNREPQTLLEYLCQKLRQPDDVLSFETGAD